MSTRWASLLSSCKPLPREFSSILSSSRSCLNLIFVMISVSRRQLDWWEATKKHSKNGKKAWTITCPFKSVRQKQNLYLNYIFSTGLLLQLEAWKLLKIYSRVLLPLGPYQALKNILKRCALPTNYRYRIWPFTMSQCYLDLNISHQQFVKGQSSNRRTKIKYN